MKQEQLDRVARNVLRERFVNTDQQAQAMGAAMMCELRENAYA
jgi:hypothetical protein